MCSFLFLSMIKSIDFSWIYCLSFTVVNERGNCLFSSVKNTRRFFRSKLLTQSLRIKCADCGGNHTASLRGCTLKMLRYITHLNLVYFWKFPFLSKTSSANMTLKMRRLRWKLYHWFSWLRQTESLHRSMHSTKVFFVALRFFKWQNSNYKG